MQRADLVVEGIATLIEAAQVFRQRRRQQRLVDHWGAIAFGLCTRRARHDLDVVEQLAAVAIGRGDDGIERGRRPFQAAQLLACAFGQLLQLVVRQALEHIDGGTRKQRTVHLERRVLGGCADEGEQAAFHMRQEGILLALVEAVDFIDKHQRTAAVGAELLSAFHRLADVLHARQHSRQRDELGVKRIRHQPRQRGLAYAWRAPEDH